VRYLGLFGSLKVRGRATKRAKLRNGDVVECAGFKLTFMDEVA
jgi:ribosome-associated protein YbcJ (S4-like RNA binding protein)